MNYLKIAVRSHLRYRGFTLLNMTGLALGIACSMVIFLYVSLQVYTDSYHRDAGRIYRAVLEIQTPAGDIEYEEGSSIAWSSALRNEYPQIETTAYCMRFYSTPTITVDNGRDNDKYKDDNIAAYADNNFINLFDHEFIYGDKQTALSNPNSVVLSASQAIKYFGNRDVVGKTININNKADLIVTGVFEDEKRPSDLEFKVLVSLPTLKVINPNYQDQNFTWLGSNNWTFVKVTDAQGIESQLPAFGSKYLGPDFKHWSIHLQPLSDMHFDTRYDGVIKKSVIWILAGVATALICIISVNYINLSIAQSNYRAKEIGLRKYLGGSKGQLFFQFMLETGTIVVLSVAMAIGVTYLILPMINLWIGTELSLGQFLNPDKVLYLVLFTMTLIFLAGYYPAVFLSGFNPITAIAGKGRRLTAANQVFRKGLICFQYVIAFLFLISTFTIVDQVNYMMHNDPGFSKEAIINITVPRNNFSKLQAYRNEVTRIQGVMSASLHHEPPMSPVMDGGFIKFDNKPEFEDFIVRDRWGDEHFADTYSLDLVAGRNLIMHDSVTEVLVNESLLRRLNITDPEVALGKTILFDNSAITGTIVGVIRDFHHRSLQNSIDPLAIYPMKGIFNQVGARLQADHRLESLALIESIWKATFPDEVFTYTYLDESIANMYHIEQVTGKLMRVFALVSVIICSIGILGLSVFSAVQRTKEIGVRKVLGASTLGIIAMLCRQYLILTTVAFVIALPVSYAVMKGWLEGFAYHISLDWTLFILPGLLIVVITLLLVGSQSLKTALANPTESLKHE